jgi:hypothetical protein
MRKPWAAALLIVSLVLAAGTASAEDERTLNEICGQTLTEDTLVRTQGGGSSFGDCAIALADARLRILEANLAGDELTVSGIGESRLLIVGTKLRADFGVSGSYVRILLSNSLFRAESAVIDLSAGRVLIRFSTFRPGEVEVSTDEGSIQVASTNFRGPASFLSRSGGADLRLSDFLGGMGVTTAGPGDLAFLSNTVRGAAAFRGEGKVVVAANTFERATDDTGDVAAEGDLAFLNNLAEGDVELHGGLGLMVIGNTFEAGSPTVEGSPLSCIVINNEPGVSCP